MSPVYRCACFAVPSKLLKKIAAKAGEADRHVMHGHIENTARLRSLRSAWSAPPPPAGHLTALAHKVPPYQRAVFDAGTGMQLPGKSVRTEGGKPVRDVAVNQVYDNTGITLDFFLQVFDRNSIDNRGMRVS